MPCLRREKTKNILFTIKSVTGKYIRQFSALFKTFDRDDSGEITFFELEEFIHDEDVQAYFASLSMSVDSAWDIFRLLDKDDSGRISTEEFISGCLSLKGFAKTIDVVKISQDLERQNKVLSQFMDFVELELASLTGKGIGNTAINCKQPQRQTRASSNSSSRQAKTDVRAREVPSPEGPPLDDVASCRGIHQSI
ncbi:unnamed protein product [Polarella glacialis]|uniref:EF-hand domain-containing protein n=1 Tax=Polarella glacialis TaxID=89957 RepID=A0A813HH01_POLGL|nr:unnamed protein product [Polarella glacialis]